MLICRKNEPTISRATPPQKRYFHGEWVFGESDWLGRKKCIIPSPANDYIKNYCYLENGFTFTFVYYQPTVPAPPLNGPTMSAVIHPP